MLNGRSLGRKPTNRSTAYTATWGVPYQAGVLHAMGFNGGKATSSADLKSAGQPSAIKLTPDRVRIVADNQDLSYVTVELVDAKGVRNPTAENSIRFAIEGPGNDRGRREC